METSHDIYSADSRFLQSTLGENSVDLVVTSPPYPMIEMWDDLFENMNADIRDVLEEDPKAAHSMMHTELSKVWSSLQRVVKPGGTVCINIGNATRNINGTFEVFDNTTPIQTMMTDIGFRMLPEVLWHKPTNKLTKYMGSGMLPSNAYVTNEHEYILIFKNGGNRDFEAKDKNRYESAFFWEERNEWFSDLWTNITGTSQLIEDDGREVRDRSAAYPEEIPHRLINMFSVYGDTVLDPFWGTGTTTAASIRNARNSVGVELNEDFISAFTDQIDGLVDGVAGAVENRLAAHETFVQESGHEFTYDAEHYLFPVKTKQEKQIQFRVADAWEKTETGYQVSHSRYDWSRRD